MAAFWFIRVHYGSLWVIMADRGHYGSFCLVPQFSTVVFKWQRCVVDKEVRGHFFQTKRLSLKPFKPSMYILFERNEQSKQFHRQNYRSKRDAEKRLGTNTTGKNLLVCCFAVIWQQRLLPLVHFCFRTYSQSSLPQKVF